MQVNEFKKNPAMIPGNQPGEGRGEMPGREGWRVQGFENLGKVGYFA